MIPTATNILSNHHFLLKMPKNNILELIMALRNFALFVVESNNAAAKMELNELKQGDSFCFNKEVRLTTNSNVYSLLLGKKYIMLVLKHRRRDK